MRTVAPVVSALLAAAAAPATAGEAFELTLEALYRVLEYPDAAGQRATWHESLSRMKLEGDAGPLRYRLVPMLRAESPALSSGIADRLADDAAIRPSLDVEEGWLRIAWGPLTLTGGKRSSAWGVADVYSPVDRVNPRDFTDPLASERMGVLSAELAATFDSWSIAVVGIPVVTPDRLPPPGSRFADATLAGVARDTANGPQIAARVSGHWKGLDASAIAHRGVDPMPVVDLLAPRLVNYRRTLLGATGSAAIGGFEVHADCVFVRPDDDRFTSYAQAVLGLSRAWSALGDRRIFAGVEYALDRTLRDARAPETVLYLPLHRPLENAIVSHGRLELTTDDELGAKAAYDFGERDFFVEMNLAHRISDEVTIELGGDIVGGPSDSPFGRFRRDGRVLAAVKVVR